MSKRRKLRLKVPFVTRVEGEGALEISATGDHIETLQLQIFEPPRLFEQLLVGRPFTDVPDLSARICGICPMAYQLTSILAMERLFQVRLPQALTDLRTLMNLGEWLQSHALHIHFLAMPDFLGFDSALAMASQHADLLKRGMQIQEAGNTLLRLLGGRSVHPVGLQVGGFSQLPSQAAWDNATRQVYEAIPAVHALLEWTARLTLPDYSQPFISVSLVNDSDYPICDGQIVSSDGLRISSGAYFDHFQEHQVEHSTALYSLMHDTSYLVGPLARLNLNSERLPRAIQDRAANHGLHFPSQNMFKSIQARALECVWALHRARELLEQGCPKEEPNVPFSVRPGTCCFSTEAPRGLIFHQYQIDESGKVVACCIIPPTSQNQARIEEDLRTSLIRFGLAKSDADITHFCERVIRNYDPCISCSTHFLDLRLHRH